MAILPPSFSYHGNKERAKSLHAEANQFYNFCVAQATVGNANKFSRQRRLSDGSIISIDSSLTSIYNHRVGTVSIYGVGGTVPKKEPQFLLNPSRYNPSWPRFLRTETWTSNFNPLNTFVRLIAKDSSWAPVSGYTLTKIYPVDIKFFTFLVPVNSDIIKNPSQYIWKLNEIVIPTYDYTGLILRWRDSARGDREIEIFRNPDIDLIDDNGDPILGYYRAIIRGGYAGIVEESEKLLIDPNSLNHSDGLITRIRVYKKKDWTTPGELVGDTTYEIISSDENYLYRAEVNTTIDPYTFFDIYRKGEGINRINNPDNKDKHFILP